LSAVAAVVVVVLFGVLGGASVSAANGPVMKPVSAQLVFKGWKDDNCHWVIGVMFGNDPGATSYVVSYWDGYYQQVTTHNIALNQLDTGNDPQLKTLIPKGLHFVGATGGNGGGSECVLPASDPTEGGRFNKGAKAWAVVSAKAKGTVAGRVVEMNCGGTTACVPKGLAGVKVHATSGPGGSAVGTSDATGHFSIDVEEGTWTVAPTLSGREFTPDEDTVKVKAGATAGGLEFRTCAIHRTTQSAGRSAARFCRTLDIDKQRPKGPNALADKFAVGFGFHGEGWDPKGGPIQTFWEGKPVKTFPQSESFEHKLFSSEWPTRDGRGCYGTLSARQGKTVLSRQLKGKPLANVVFAVNDQIVKSGDIVCKGETLALTQTTGTVILLYRSLSVTGSAWIYIYRGGGRFKATCSSCGILTGAAPNAPGPPDANLAYIFPVGAELCLPLHPARFGYLHAVRDPNGGISGDIQRQC
jgi:hypothetical protein